MVRSMPMPRQVLHSLDDVPTFASEAEEAEFWDTHELGEELLAQMRPPPPQAQPPAPAETETITLRFDRDTIERIKALARTRRKSARAMLQQFVLERLAQEERVTQDRNGRW